MANPLPFPQSIWSLSRRRTQVLAWAIAALLGLILSLGLTHLQRANRLDPNPRAGGQITLDNRSSHAFSQIAPGLSAREVERHADGDANFDAVFVTAPAMVNPGLGPLFNNASCTSCHLKDGRGMPELGQALVRVSVPGTVTPSLRSLGAVPVRGIGTQLRDQAIYGHLPDAAVEIHWQEQSGQYGDGTAYTLRSPQLRITQTDPAKPIPDNVLTSLRVAPPVFGTGLLEAVPEKTVIAQADEGDRNRDGISGKPNWVWDPQHQRQALGRFGLKANTSSLLVQTAAAYVNDMGITNPLFPEGDQTPDIDSVTLEDTTFYTQTLGVPARGQLQNPSVRRGERLFAQANCTTCHLPTLKTGPAAIAPLAHQTIHPYTDLLLHDLGEGLADGRPDFEANGQEWRTSPLWGIGLTQTVLPYAGYLHDGRARSLEEAILWHGGEAEASKAMFMAMGKSDRQDLLKLLNSL